MNQQNSEPLADSAGNIVKDRFSTFLREFHISSTDSSLDHASQFSHFTSYQDHIAAMIKNDKNTIFVDLAHLSEFDQELLEAIELEYFRFEPYVRKAVQEYVFLEHSEYVQDVDKGVKEIYVSFFNHPRIDCIRGMKTDKIGRLIAVSGTVTRSSEVRPELLLGSFTCRKCGAAHASVEQQLQFTEPQICKNQQCASHDFQLNLDASVFVDWQRLRVQENSEEIPPGSMPRCLDVICRNEVVEMAKAGDKIVFTGYLAVVPDSSGLATAGENAVSGKTTTRSDNSGVTGLKKLGVKELTFKMVFIACSIQHVDAGGRDVAGEEETAVSPDDMDEILKMRSTPKLYLQMMDSLCPSVFGHPEVKRGILLMLFGGVHKTTPEGIPLRGDINVCIVGDPSCAKSQFLKFVHQFMPRSIYTSGKASSAAGLTATVVKDNETGEFCVEAGALMLADNGICCIDEFDKMDPHDQVAIHEAMEQQTISITKAGIQATLNARTAILAAANPIYGRYDRTKTLKANVAISAPIMSRFDLFFVILDECNPKVDESIARHIIDMHKSGGAQDAAKNAPFTPDQLKKYIRFARSINPIISEEGQKVLVECYRMLRQNDNVGKNKTAYRITVRQLESLVRLSEALARLHLDEIVKPTYIKEAYRLLQQSIIFVEMEDIELDVDDLPTPEEPEEVAPAPEILPETMPETEMTIAPDTETAPADTQKRKRESEPGKKKKAKTMISAEQYRSMTAMIAIILRSQEDLQGSAFRGVLMKDLLKWYLEQHMYEVTDDASFEEKKKLVMQVVRRMMKHEEAVIEAEMYDDSVPLEDRYLKLHPSYDI